MSEESKVDFALVLHLITDILKRRISPRYQFLADERRSSCHPLPALEDAMHLVVSRLKIFSFSCQ